MKDWYLPDTRWPFFGINSREDYVQRYVYEGRFHADVPADIVKTCETASQLMAQAWHYYPLYDEAVNKLLFSVEMAVKIHCRQLGLSVGKGDTLHALIKKLDTAEPAKQLSHQLDIIRQLRNSISHPSHYSFGGVTMGQGILPMINLLNQLFLKESVVIQNAVYLEQLRQEQLSQGLLGLDCEQYQGVLLAKAVPCRVHQVLGQRRVIWRLEPAAVPGVGVPPPIWFVLYDVEMREEMLTGKDVITGGDVCIKPTALSPLILQMFARDRVGMAELDPDLAVVQEFEIRRKLDELVYRWFWEGEERD